MQAAADTLKRVHLELGGKAPVVVFDDADLEAADRRGARLRLLQRRPGLHRRHAGCWPGPGIHDDFVAGLADAAKSLVVGDPADEATELGPVVSAEQRERVAGFVDRAGGGRRRAGHRRRAADRRRASTTSRRSSPASAQDDEIVQREVFGPVVTVQRFTDEAEAIGVGQRRRLRAGRVGVDERRRPGAARGQRAAVRHGVGQRPRPARVGDAPRRLQAVGRRQGHVGVRDRGLHRAEARDDQDRRGLGACNGPTALDDIDRAIIEQLQQRRPPPLHPARAAVGLSEAAVRQRVQRLSTAA